VFVHIGKTADFLKSNIDHLIKTYREASQRGDRVGKFLFGGLLVLRIGVLIGVWGFLGLGIGIVATICGASNNSGDFVKSLRGLLLDLYDFIRGVLKLIVASAGHGESVRRSFS
jgi:hypothetical protein